MGTNMTPADHAHTVRKAVEEALGADFLGADFDAGRADAEDVYAVRIAALDALQTQAALGEALEHVLKGWESAYPESVFPPLVDGELKRAMKLCNSEDPNQSARLYAEWARHIVRCIRDQAEATA